MKRTTNDTMKRSTVGRIAAGVALMAALAPGAAYAASDAYAATALEAALPSVSVGEAAQEGAGYAFAGARIAGVADQRSSYASGQLASSGTDAPAQTSSTTAEFSALYAGVAGAATVSDVALASADEVAGDSDGQTVAQDASEKLLSYDPEDLAAIGTQESTGHSICCPSFSCAYADAVMDGTVHDHEYYTCSCCTWTDWGGGDSAYRCVGSDEELLREAYEQISAGRPTVIHVAADYGEHWIALIGYTRATDPDNLTLDNFIALDPWDGAQIIASERFSLYGDGCEHVSDR